MNRKHFYTFLVLFLFGLSAWTQNKYEREYRIKKSQFPQASLDYISDRLEDARRIRFYKETDSTKISYEVKFKKDRLKYSVEFTEEGVLEDVEIEIKPLDIPNDAYTEIKEYLSDNFAKHNIRKIQQQYSTADSDTETTLKNAFQNLLLPSIKYELIINAKKDGGYAQFEVLFDAQGDFISMRKSLPPNYDHVLY
ncbi:MAG: hypothetical protein HKN31_05520 [Pricia sp.]|nr:hypothetical protein [Pricia sp.]